MSGESRTASLGGTVHLVWPVFLSRPTCQFRAVRVRCLEDLLPPSETEDPAAKGEGTERLKDTGSDRSWLLQSLGGNKTE